jgi:hypothetical protein
MMEEAAIRAPRRPLASGALDVGEGATEASGAGGEVRHTYDPVGV